MAEHDKADAGPQGLQLDPSMSRRALTIVDNQVESRDLFASAREIIIAHGLERYRLRVTSQNKLILTK
jgi:hemin uptake protein HemP